jgi:hypothetical protein
MAKNCPWQLSPGRSEVETRPTPLFPLGLDLLAGNSASQGKKTRATLIRAGGTEGSPDSSTSQLGAMVLPPLETVKTPGTPGEPPDSPVTPPRTVIWPPVGNVSRLPNAIVIASPAAL